ncbi:uncharacterized protein HKW66_Vig0119730 [Vigna angularis]|uniref:Uncharacterized protein n=1 Tax=Phaseolus angularis TaxID=3914 RepID=A0A8T0JZ22_PHAAN|nr:uncharacterized protein HKW66_Vig0119730 [Vigna angularis]
MKTCIAPFKWNYHHNDDKACNLMAWVSMESFPLLGASFVSRGVKAMLIMIDRSSYLLTADENVRNSYLFDSLRIYDQMKQRGWTPTIHCETGKLAEARVVFNAMVEGNVCPTTETYHAFFEGTDYS